MKALAFVTAFDSSHLCCSRKVGGCAPGGAVVDAADTPPKAQLLWEGARGMTKIQTWRLFGLLRQSESLRTRGFSLSCAQDGIVIDRLGHVHGIWDFDGGSYTWITPGNSQPIFRTDDPASAVQFTIVTLA
jgi:hypothetical protein